VTDSGDGGEGGGDELPCATEGVYCTLKSCVCRVILTCRLAFTISLTQSICYLMSVFHCLACR